MAAYTKQKILVVDDDENICDLIKIYMEKEGFEVFVSYDGLEVIYEFPKNPGLQTSKSIDYLSSVKILEQRAKIDGNKISEYFVDLDLTFLIDLNRKDDK